MKKENKNCHPRMLLSGISLADYVNKENTSYNNNTQARDCRTLRAARHSAMTALFKSRAFTLIELLVVVLIIGILAAVAVPQYERAVLKSKYVQLMAFGNAIYQAAQSYRLANGVAPERFDVLDINIPGAGVAATRLYGNYECNLYTNRNDRKDAIVCYYQESKETTLGYHINYSNKRSCMASYTWQAGNQLCQQMTGLKEATSQYGEAGSSFHFNRYQF